MSIVHRVQKKPRHPDQARVNRFNPLFGYGAFQANVLDNKVQFAPFQLMGDGQSVDSQGTDRHQRQGSGHAGPSLLGIGGIQMRHGIAQPNQEHRVQPDPHGGHPFHGIPLEPHMLKDAVSREKNKPTQAQQGFPKCGRLQGARLP